MFESKKCPKCNNKIKEDFDFCPSCGNKLKSSEEDFGMLGKNDFFSEPAFNSNPFGIFNSGMFNKLVNSTMKMFEEEMQKKQKGMNSRVELFINGKRINPQNIKVTKTPAKTEQKKKKVVYLPNNELEKFSSLEQEEPQTRIRRLADSIIYEIEIPGVSSEKDISIRQISNSLEIKAVAGKKAYFKSINVGLPIVGYEFTKGLLVLELEARN